MCANVTGDPLTAEDARILGLETERVAGHTLKVMLLDRGAELPLGELRDWVGERVGRVPRLTQRLELDDGGAAWVPDRGFDVARHVRRAEEADTLAATVAASMERRLDRRRPLWSVELVDGTAVVLKVHHALADGMGARRIACALLWDADDPAPGPARSPAAAGPAHGLRRAVGALQRELAPAASPSALARRVGPARAGAFAAIPLTVLEPLKRAFAVRVTINDLVLAATAGGLRRWLEQLGAPLTAMRVKVPVSLHRADEGQLAVGNADAFFFADLPVAEPDPERRLLAIARECSARKRAGDAQEIDALMRELAGRSPAAGRAAVRWSMSPHVFTLNVSNVPGPRHPVRVCDRPLRAVYALAEVADWHALRIAVFSACGRLTFGLCGDAEHVRALDVLAREIEAEIPALVALRR